MDRSATGPGGDKNITEALVSQAPVTPEGNYSLDLSYVPVGSGGAGQIASITYPSGKVLSYQYDATGQLIGLSWNGQALLTNLTWTPLGSPKGWTWSFVSGAPSTSRSYNTAGQLTNSDIAAYTWDAAGRVSQITQNLYGPAITPNGSAQPLAITTTIGYDAVGHVISLAHAPVGTPSLPAGILLQDLIGPLSAVYTYDANGNRASANYSQYAGSGGINSMDRSFTLDPSHNKVLAVQDNYNQTGGGIFQQSRTLQWDASGRLTSDDQLTFEYDPRGRIAKIFSLLSGGTTYLNNSLNQRVRKVESGGVITDTVYGDEELGLASYPLGHYRPNSNGGITSSTEYIYLPTAQGPMPIAVQIGNALYAIDSDHLNTPRKLTDQNGKPVWQWITSGFGELEPTTAETGFTRARLNTGTPPIANTPIVEFNLRYPGQQYDRESGLYYNHNRYYDPYLTVGYTQADPLGLAAGWNRFRYADANPIKFVDPEGLANSGAIKWMTPPSNCFDFDQFASYIQQNRLDLDVALATLSSSFAFGTMPKTPSELRGLGVPRSQLNPYTSQLSRWSGRTGNRILRELGRTSVGVAAGAAATGAVVFEGFYDWTIIAQALTHAQSPENCSCKR